MEVREQIVLAAGVGEAEAIDHEGATLHPLDFLVLHRHRAESSVIVSSEGFRESFGALKSKGVLKIWKRFGKCSPFAIWCEPYLWCALLMLSVL